MGLRYRKYPRCVSYFFEHQSIRDTLDGIRYIPFKGATGNEVRYLAAYSDLPYCWTEASGLSERSIDNLIARGGLYEITDRLLRKRVEEAVRTWDKFENFTEEELEERELL